MHKLMLKFFGFLKSSAQFLKVLSVFCVMCLVLYWIKDIASFNWTWLNFIAPLLEVFIKAGSAINENAINYAGATYEYKYFIAFLLLFTLYFVAHGLQIWFTFLEDLYSDGRRIIKNMQEDAYNKDLEKQNITEQEQIKKYQIYVAARAKKQVAHLAAKINLEEEVKNMNKFLMQKTGISPIKYGDGFLYSFSDFNHIDTVLPHFFKLIQSKAPLDYVICVQILPKEITDEFEKMKKLIHLNLYNQITTLSDTVWRYKFNETHRYNTVQLGLYQKENDTFEVQEFVEF